MQGHHGLPSDAVSAAGPPGGTGRRRCQAGHGIGTRSRPVRASRAGVRVRGEAPVRTPSGARDPSSCMSRGCVDLAHRPPGGRRERLGFVLPALGDHHGKLEARH